MQNIVIRDVTLEDTHKLVEIYAPYVLNTAITFEYEVPTMEEFSNRIKAIHESYPYLVAEVDNEVVGYTYASVFHSRAAYQWCAEVSIYLDANIHNKGIGRKLYEELERRLKLQNIKNMNACITYSNESSIAFHKHMGFKTVGHFHKCGYKLNQWWDMIWMEKIIDIHEKKPKNFIKVNKQGIHID